MITDDDIRDWLYIKWCQIPGGPFHGDYWFMTERNVYNMPERMADAFISIVADTPAPAAYTRTGAPYI